MGIALLLAFVSTARAAAPADDAVVTGKVSAGPACLAPADQRPPEVWLSIGQILLYQVEVPVGGNFEFHVVPGKYDVVANNSKGCVAQAEVKVKAGQTARAELALSEKGQEL
jgi:hypothetical protein